MTSVDPQTHPEARPEARPAAPIPDERNPERPLPRLCPYLTSADGAWRSATFAREHRCGAVAPPAPLAAEKQRRLCLTPDFATCATFEAARAGRPVVPERAAILPRPLARTTPMVLDHGRIELSVPAFRSDRSMGQAILIVLLALAFAAVLLAKLAGGTTPVGATDPSPTARAGSIQPSGSPTATPASGASGTPVASGSAGTSAAPPSAGASSPAARTYKVKGGDTLVGIAAKFGTTPKAIASLNGLKDASSLKIGQVLKIP